MSFSERGSLKRDLTPKYIIKLDIIFINGLVRVYIEFKKY